MPDHEIPTEWGTVFAYQKLQNADTGHPQKLGKAQAYQRFGRVGQFEHWKFNRIGDMDPS